MPAVYHDPIYGNKPARFTHYAALVGGGPGPKLAGSNRPVRTAFAATGVKMKNVTILPLERLSERAVRKAPSGDFWVSMGLDIRFEQHNDGPDGFERLYTDGVSNTIVVTAVSPDREILWTKPEDITVGPEFPLELGRPGGIAAPYSFGKGAISHRAAPVLFADGTSSALLDTIQPAPLYAFLTPSGGEVVERGGGGTRVGGYLWSHFPKLVIDCESGSATIIEPNQAIRPDLEIRTLDEPGVGGPGGAPGQADQPASTSAIWLPYPYEPGWTYKVAKVDPGGTAQIVEVGSPGKGYWPSLIEDLYLMLVQPLVDGGEPRLLRVEVSDVLRHGLGPSGSVKPARPWSGPETVATWSGLKI